MLEYPLEEAKALLVSMLLILIVTCSNKARKQCNQVKI